MNILHIWDGDYPWDIRVDKISTSLIKNEHSVHIVCRNLKRSPLKDSYNGAAIYRLPFLPNWLGSLNKSFSFPAFFSPVWLFRIYQVAKKQNCDLIIVRDLPMALAGIMVAKFIRVPCILDMAECYPEMLRCTWKFEGLSFKNILVRNPWLADVVERIVMKYISHIWVMIEESKDRLLRFNVEEERISIVSNTPIINRFQVSDESKKLDDFYHMIYVGLLNPSRGLDTVIDAVFHYSQKNSNFRFSIVGAGKSENFLKSKVNELSLEKHITFLGWVDNDEIPHLMANADIGIVPHHNCSHWASTIPNKLFDYMAAGKPVIVSDVAPMKRIVNTIGCGRIYQDYDPKKLCDVIMELNDPELRKKLGRKGREAIRKDYNWAREEKTIFSSIDNVKKQV